jgi:hypothetical protein
MKDQGHRPEHRCPRSNSQGLGGGLSLHLWKMPRATTHQWFQHWEQREDTGNWAQRFPMNLDQDAGLVLI